MFYSYVELNGIQPSVPFVIFLSHIIIREKNSMFWLFSRTSCCSAHFQVAATKNGFIIMLINLVTVYFQYLTVLMGRIETVKRSIRARLIFKVSCKPEVTEVINGCQAFCSTESIWCCRDDVFVGQVSITLVPLTKSQWNVLLTLALLKKIRPCKNKKL